MVKWVIQPSGPQMFSGISQWLYKEAQNLLGNCDDSNSWLTLFNWVEYTSTFTGVKMSHS